MPKYRCLSPRVNRTAGPAGGSLTPALARTVGSLAIVAAITAFYFSIFKQANSTTIALTLLLAILGIATRWGLLEALVASVVGVMCFNFFFLPPRFTFYLANTQNWVALGAFLVTAVVASQLSASAKRRAIEAMRQREEVEKLYELSRALMQTDKQSPIGSQIAARIGEIFEIPGVAVFDREADRVYGASASERIDLQLRRAALSNTAFHDAELSVLPLILTAEAVGTIAIYGSAVSDTAVQAVGNLAAIAVERSRAEAAASRMEAARQNEAMKAMLLDALAHEFKTPLTSIKAAASSILDESGQAQTELRAVIEEEADRLDSLVMDTIQMARIEAGDLQLQIQPFPLRDLIASALKSLKPLMEDREIKVHVPPDAPEVLADPDLASLAIRQLVSNALKYSYPESPIEILSCAENGAVKISVKDYGPGIPAKEQRRIFERYYRAPQNTAPVPGSGLGLHIAKNIVQAHHGEIWLESEPGQGCEFFLTLPAGGS